MSLENSQFTFASLQCAGAEQFRKEVDRITKEADGEEAVPSKRGRYTQSQDNGIGSQTLIRRQARVVSGTILEVTLVDFLCHHHMTVKLNPQINFIVGRNGSGKSAILTALVVALGGNANTTGRGTSLKDFIRHGAQSAEVTCVVNNAGALHFRREEYGDKIIVVRKLLRQGGSSIKMRSANNKLISSKMEDLRAMTLGLGIQVDNPISVLDQNTARQFLNQSKPSTKFELFMRATNLETLQDIYVEISLLVAKLNQEIGKKDRQLIDNNTEVIEAKRKYDMIKNLAKDRARANSLKMELLWAEARDCRLALTRAAEELKKVKGQKEHLNSILSSEEQTEPLLQKIESSKIDIRTLDNQQKEIENELKDLKVQLAAVNQTLKKWHADKQRIESQLKQEEKTIEEYKDEIRAQETRMMPGHVDERRRQREQIQELEGSIQEKRIERDSKKKEFELLQSKLNASRDVLDQLKSSKRRSEDQIRNHKRELQGLQANDSNLTLFGPFITALVNQIEANQHRFKKKPIGPLGLYVRVKDPQWTLAVESVTKSRLNTFVVDNADDERLLHSLIKRIGDTRGPRPGVVRTPFTSRAYDTSNSAARTSLYPNVMDVIEVSNVVALNMLIELCRIENTMLIPSDSECHQLLSDARTVPRNCLKAYTRKADQYMPAPQYRTYASTQHKSWLLQTSRDDAIRDTQQKISELERELPTITQSISNAEKDIQNHGRMTTQTKQAIHALSQTLMEMNARLEQLKDQEQPEINTVSVLRDELAEKERQFLTLQERLEKLPSEAEITKKKKDEIVKNGTELQKKVKDINKQKEELQSEVITLTEQVEEQQSAKMTKKRKLDQVIKQEERLNKECEELEGKYEKCKGEAEKYEDFIESELQQSSEDEPSDKKEKIVFESKKNTKRKIKDVDQELRAINKRLASVEKTLGQNTDSLELDYKEKLEAFNQTKTVIEQLKHNSAILKHALEQRKKLYHTQKSLMCAVTSHQFTRVLRFRNCNGKVKVSFEKKELHISVGPIDEGERTGLGTSSLSGGERSYATMAFVIALWNVTELPFYYLDEFDVFMDCLNRQTVLTLLLRFAKQKTGYQFGFLTPLDTAAITSGDDPRVSIFRLDDPVRG